MLSCHIHVWLPLLWSLSIVNRSVGHDELDPFVLLLNVLDKIQFTHAVIDEVPSVQTVASRYVAGVGPARMRGEGPGWCTGWFSATT